MAWQDEFVETFYEVVKQENRALNRFNKNRVADHVCGHSVEDLTEVHLQYLLFKGLLNNSYFDRWHVSISPSYGEMRNTRSRKQHADFSLAYTKYGKVDYSSQITIEMKKWQSKRAREDYKRLQEKSDNRGLLIYQFGKRSVSLEAKISKSPEFKRLMKKFKITTRRERDMKVNVVNKDGNHERHHFEAVLLSWKVDEDA